MPTYQYACTECDHRFDAVQAFADTSLAECPECAGKLRKLYGAVGVVFKGSGFYRTDNRSKASSETSSTSSSGSGDSSSNGDSSGSTSSSSSGDSSSTSSSTPSTTSTPAVAAS